MRGGGGGGGGGGVTDCLSLGRSVWLSISLSQSVLLSVHQAGGLQVSLLVCLTR